MIIMETIITAAEAIRFGSNSVKYVTGRVSLTNKTEVTLLIIAASIIINVSFMLRFLSIKFFLTIFTTPGYISSII